jgi:hypothetical protein
MLLVVAVAVDIAADIIVVGCVVQSVLVCYNMQSERGRSLSSQTQPARVTKM